MKEDSDLPIRKKSPTELGSRNYRRVNPRLDRRFNVTLKFDGFSVNTLTTNVSSYGATMEVPSLEDYEYLSKYFHKLKPFFVSVQTDLNDLKGEINAVFEDQSKYFVGLKLLEDRSWYS